MEILNLFTFPHFLLIITVLIVTFIGILFVLTHKPDNWFFLHKLFMGLGLIIAIIGELVIGALNLNILYTVLGVITVILLAVNIGLGWYANKENDRKLRSGHIWFGRIVYIFATVVLILIIITFI